MLQRAIESTNSLVEATDDGEAMGVGAANLNPCHSASGARDEQRLTCFGEALCAAFEYAKLEQTFADCGFDTVEFLDEAFNTMRSSRQDFTKEDFALYVLSDLLDRLDGDENRRALQIGAARYLRDKRQKLSPDLAALEPAASGRQQTSTSKKGGDTSDHIKLASGNNNLSPSNGRKFPPLSENFLVTFEKLKGDERHKSPEERHRSKSQRQAIQRPWQAITPGEISVELNEIRARRLGIVKRLRRRSIARGGKFAIALLSIAVLVALGISS